MAQRVRVTITSGRVRVIGEPRPDVRVDGEPRSSAAGEIEARGGSDAMEVRVPAGTDVVVGSSSGEVTLEGTLGAVSVTTASASVDADDVASIDARTVSGRLRVRTSRGPARLRTTSATVRVGRAEDEVRVATVSGQVEIDDAHGAVAIKTVSGHVDVTLTGAGPVGVESISGNIDVRVPPGVRPDVRARTASGKPRVRCETGDDVVITARSLNGPITVRTA